MEPTKENFISRNIEVVVIVAITFIAPLLQSLTVNTLQRFSFYGNTYITYIIPLSIFISFLLLGIFDYKGKRIQILKVYFALIVWMLFFNWFLSIEFNSSILDVYSLLVHL
jgi:hypothetical protein